MFIRFTKNDFFVTMRNIGIILMWSSLTFLLPIFASFYYKEPLTVSINYLLCGIIALMLGFFLKILFKSDKELETKHAYVAISILWILYTAIAALPFVLIHNANFVDAFFESMSAITTTGLTILPNIDNMVFSLLFWRSLISWIGGIGIVVIVMVGLLTAYTKAAKLLSAEGRQERIKPNIKNTAKEMILIYLFLTFVGTTLLIAGGMRPFFALNYAMSAISTTGFDLTKAGLTVAHNWLIDASLILIMIMGATSFYTHYFILRRKNLEIFIKDREFQLMLLLAFISAFLLLTKFEFLKALFYTTSAITCGGFALDLPKIIAQWEDWVKFTLILLMLIGGSAGSTAGGIKLSRFWLFLKSIYWKIKEAILPKGTYFAKKFEDIVVSNEEIAEIHQFILLYILLIFIGSFVLTLCGYNLSDSLFEVVSAQGNAGISAGVTNVNMPLGAKIMLIINMWFGRLEIIPILSLIGLGLSAAKGKVF